MTAMNAPAPQAELLPSGAQWIAAGSYPAVMRKSDATMFLAHLRSDETRERGERAITGTANTLREAVIGYVRRLDEAFRAFDTAALFAQAHEIRGLAGSAGLGAAGRMANGLCLYLDALDGDAPCAETVRLHIEAIQRVVSGEDEGAIANVVAEELTALVIRKLGESHALGLGR